MPSESASTEMPTRIVYVVFESSGGMRHYAEGLSSAMSTIADSTLVGPGEVEGFCALDHQLITKLTKRYNPFYYRRIADAIVKRYEPDLVHITSTSIGLMPFVARLRRKNIEVVYTIHDPLPHERKKRLWDALVERYHCSIQISWLLTHCSAIHVHTNTHVDAIHQKYGARSVEKMYAVQHGGGATAAILSGTDLPMEWEGESNLFTFLFFGRIEPYKGLSVLLSAFKTLVTTIPQCRLVIAGAGLIDTDIRFAPFQCILINRFIRDSEIRQIFEHSSAVVLPYLSATQSGVIPLAYEFSKPVICSDVGGMPEMVVPRQTGLIVPPDDAKALANAMRYLVENSYDARQMGEAARAYMTQQFSWKTVAQQHRVKYETLLAWQETRGNKAQVT